MPPKVALGSGSHGGSTSRFRGPTESDQSMPHPKWVQHKVLENMKGVPDKLKKLRACWIEVVQKVCKATGRKKERFLVVMEYFIAFAHMDGTISKVVCLSDVFRAFFADKGKRFYLELKDCPTGMHWVHHPSHKFNREVVTASYPDIPMNEEQWLTLSFVNNARGAFTKVPIRLIQTSDISHSVKSRCIPTTPSVLVPGMDFVMVHIKKEASDVLGLGFIENMLVSVVEGSAGEKAGCGEHLGKRLIVLNGHGLDGDDREVSERCAGQRWISMVFDTTRLAAPQTAVAVPSEAVITRESVDESFGLKFNDALVLVDVPKKATTRHLRSMRGMALTHIDDTPVASLPALLQHLSSALRTNLTFDSNNEVYVHLAEGQDFRNSGLVLSPSLHLLGVKKGTPAFRSCHQFEKRYKILKVNGQLVTNLSELREALTGYLTFRLFFQTLKQ